MMPKFEYKPFLVPGQETATGKVELDESSKEHQDKMLELLEAEAEVLRQKVSEGRAGALDRKRLQELEDDIASRKRTRKTDALGHVVEEPGK
jgi:hypothetical protein